MIARKLPLLFRTSVILSRAGVDFSARSSVRGVGVRIHASHTRREAGLNRALRGVYFQLVGYGYENEGRQTGAHPERALSGAVSF